MWLFYFLTLSTDLKDVDKMLFYFPLGTPLHPYMQLMGVLPLESRDQIPIAYHYKSVFVTWFGLVIA